MRQRFHVGRWLLAAASVSELFTDSAVRSANCGNRPPPHSWPVRIRRQGDGVFACVNLSLFTAHILLITPSAAIAENAFLTQLDAYLLTTPAAVRIAYSTVDLLGKPPGIPRELVRLENGPPESIPLVYYASVSGNGFFLSQSKGEFDPQNYSKHFDDSMELCGGRWSGGHWSKGSYANSIDIFADTSSLSFHEDFLWTTLHLGLPKINRGSLTLRDGRMHGIAQVMDNSGASVRWVDKPFSCESVPDPVNPRVRWRFDGQEGAYLVTYRAQRQDSGDYLWPPLGYQVDFIGRTSTNAFYEVRLHELKEMADGLEDGTLDIVRRIDPGALSVFHHGQAVVTHVSPSGTRTLRKAGDQITALERLVYIGTIVIVAGSLPLGFLYRRYKQRRNSNTTYV